MPIESFGTTLIHWTFFLMTRTKLAFVGFVAAGISMWHQVLDDVKASASLSQISPQGHATLPTHQTVPSTTPYYKVLQSAIPVLFCTTKYYSSTTLYYKVLLQKVLLQYYKVLIQYYSVLQSTSPVLHRPQSTTPVLLRTSKPVLLRTTRYYSVLQSTSPVLLRTTKYYSSTTQYHKVLLQYYSVLQSTSPVLLRTTRY